MKNYSKRVWLNKNGSASTGSVVAFHGETTYGDDDPIVSTFFEVADCRGKVSLHKIKADSMVEFIEKMRLLASVASEFANYLEKMDNETPF